MQILSYCPQLSGFFSRLPRRVRRLVAGWRAEGSGGHYRPEKHYMRGPGPKSRAKAKHGNPNSTAA
jgi:hypothetical protein